MPGVTLVQHGSEGKGYQFLVRGFDAMHGADFEVTLDGVPLNEWSNVHAQGYLDLGFVIPELIETVRVTKGPFTLEQGAFAMAGSADYHLGVPTEARGLRAAYTLGTTHRHRGLVSYSPKDGDGHDFIASETLYDAGFGRNRRVSKGALLARAQLLRSERSGNLSLLTAGYVARFQLPGALRDEDLAAGRIAFRDSYDPSARGASLRGLTALSYEYTHEHTRLRGLAYAGLRRQELVENFTGYLFDRAHGDRRAQHQDALSFGASLALTSRLTRALGGQLSAGVRGDVLEQQQRHVGENQRVLAEERGLDAAQALSWAALGFDLRPIDAVRIDAGLRLDVAHLRAEDALSEGAPGSGTLGAVSPRAIVEWRALAQLRLLAAYGRGFRPPEARAYTGFDPSQVGLREELFEGGAPAMTTCDALELGARYRASRYFAAQLSTFATFVARESVYDHVSGVNLELNGTRRLGAELSLRGAPRDWLLLSADVTAVDARFLESGSPVPFAPTLFGGARAAYGRELGPRAGLRVLAVAPRPLPHGAKSSSTAQLDATAGYHWETWRIELELENVLNRQVREAEFHFASHWQRAEPPSSLPVLHYFAAAPLNARLTLSAVF